MIAILQVDASTRTTRRSKAATHVWSRTPAVMCTHCIQTTRRSKAAEDYRKEGVGIASSLTEHSSFFSSSDFHHFLRASPSAVIPLMEVYNKSLCQPRELLVEILQEYPEEVEHIFIPSCVVLTRCAGCCNDETLQCMPTSSYNVTMEVWQFHWLIILRGAILFGEKGRDAVGFLQIVALESGRLFLAPRGVSVVGFFFNKAIIVAPICQQ